MALEVTSKVPTDASPTEHLTDELLNQLLASSKLESYLAEPEVADHSLTDYLGQLLKEKKLTRAKVTRAAGIGSTVIYDYFAGKSCPGRDQTLAIAFGLNASLSEVQRLLRLAGHSELYSRQRRDAIIIWCLKHGYGRAECDDELYRLGEPTLLHED